MFEDAENNIFCFKSGRFAAQCAAPGTISSTSKKLKHAAAIFSSSSISHESPKILVFGKGLAKFVGPCPACIEYVLLGKDSDLIKANKTHNSL